MAKNDTSTTPAGKGTRPRKSAAEKAQLELEQATKHRDVVAAKLEKAKPAVVALEAELKQADALVEYLAKNPLLPQPEVEEPTTGDATADPNGEQDTYGDT